MPRRLAPLPRRLVPSLAILSLCCGGGADAPAEVALQVVKGSVAFAPALGTDTAPDPRVCEEAVALAVAALPPLKAELAPGAVPRLDVTGMWERQGEDVALLLEAKIAGAQLRAPIEASVVATGRPADSDAADAIVRRGVGDLGAAFSAMIALYGADEAAWMRALEAAEPDEQVLALALLADAKSRAAVPAIGAVLGDPREQVAEAAADALVAIGDERAVPLLIGAIRRGDVRSEVRAIEALSRIGGKEARAYLEMTALGHEIPEVRALSAGALERLSATPQNTR